LNRHAQRRSYFVDALVKLCGGTLAGKRVLDLGCNAGFWSLAMLEHGADFVLGIDGRGRHLEQAQLVFDTKGIDPTRYKLVEGDFFDIQLTDVGTFDIVLCLGLLYHVSKPVALMESIAPVSSDLLVIDTRISRLPGSCFEVHREESLDNPMNAVDYELVLWPTRTAIADLAAQFGYDSVALKPAFTNWRGARDYRAGTRRAFIASKQTRLEGLTVEPMSQGAQARDYATALTQSVTSRLPRLIGRRSSHGAFS
jgi:SAM-dependent methyltransferase